MATALTDIDLQLEFSTAQPEALLLLAAGPADYLLLQLYSGRLQVSDVALLDSFSSFQCTPPTRGPDPSSKATLWLKAQHEGALPPPGIVRKDPRVPHTARRGA